MDRKPNEREHVFDKPHNVRRVLLALYSVCAVVLLLDVVDLVLPLLGFHRLRHAETGWEGLPGFYAIFGFVACVGLVLVAVELRKAVMRKEDYYDR